MAFLRKFGALMAGWIAMACWLEPLHAEVIGSKPPPSTAETPAAIHWSFQPLQAAVPPTPGHPIDTFIRAALASKGLELSPPAPPTELVRRLYFDLIGLPPTPADVDRYLSDLSPDRYERLVDQLLSSPRYGERWGRHWLDLARFSESTGFEYDRLRENAWYYRDYVIRSFNEDKPYDQFIREQVAGDVLEPLTTDGIIAPSLLVCGAYDQAGNAQANATQRAITREEEMEDLLSVVGQTFLGLTVNCARCHDHKFDPIPQRDYYRLKSVFDGVKHGERPVSKDGPVAYTGVRVQPSPTHRLKRGDVKSPEEIVSPAALSAITTISNQWGLSPDAPEGTRRLRFAEWLTDPLNPLPARVMVNRLWQFHFGNGLVATPSDFGLNGARPSHPELLDWLAATFIQSGWSLKTMHRWMVTSSAYRQSSRANPDALRLDADDQYLWRFPPRRLEAEVVRDAMLAVSGELNLEAGGPSFRPFTTTDFNATFYFPFDRGEAEFNRRTVYRMNVNSGKDPFLDAFDCPDPSVKTPRRTVTTTPLQALSLMNGDFVLRQAQRLAQRAELMANGGGKNAIRAAYRIALGRVPSALESNRASEAVRQRGLPEFCWALLNSTEFIYVQ